MAPIDHAAAIGNLRAALKMAHIKARLTINAQQQPWEATVVQVVCVPFKQPFTKANVELISGIATDAGFVHQFGKPKGEVHVLHLVLRGVELTPEGHRALLNNLMNQRLGRRDHACAPAPIIEETTQETIVATTRKPLRDIRPGDRIAGPGNAVKGKIVASIEDSIVDGDGDIYATIVTFTDGSSAAFDDWSSNLEVAV